MIKYAFTLKEMKPFGGVSGIYAIGYQDEIFYIGQSVDIKVRLQKHRREKAFDDTLKEILITDGRVNKCKALAMYNFINEHREDIYFIILEETTELNEREQYYIEKYRPRYNYKGIDVPYTHPCF